MKNRFLVVLAVLAVLLESQIASAWTSPAQIGTWENVRDLKSHSEVLVELRNGTTVRGRLASASVDRLIVGEGHNRRDIEQTSIRKVYHLYRTIGHTTRTGTLVGLRISGPFLRPILENRRCTGRDPLACGLVELGAAAVIVTVIPVGTAGGLAVGLLHVHRRLIYQD